MYFSCQNYLSSVNMNSFRLVAPESFRGGETATKSLANHGFATCRSSRTGGTRGPVIAQGLLVPGDQ